jgi:hypothetical protein
MFSYVSFISTEYATGTDGNSFPLANRTTFKLVFEESINSLHLSGSHGMFSSIINAFELGQNTKPSSSEKVISALTAWSCKKRFLRPFLRDSTAEGEIQEVEIYS